MRLDLPTGSLERRRPDLFGDSTLLEAQRRPYTLFDLLVYWQSSSFRQIRVSVAKLQQVLFLNVRLNEALQVRSGGRTLSVAAVMMLL